MSQTITEGAYVNLQVKYGLIRLISTTADLCEQIQNVELECPIEKGVISIVKSVDLPSEIPPVRRPAFCLLRSPFCLPLARPRLTPAQGKYTVLADVYTVDDEPVTCLTATVTFSRDGSVNVEL